MGEDSQWEYNVTSQNGIINIVMLSSSIIQTLLFIYHMVRHDWTSKLPHMHEYLEYFAVVFFILAMTLPELNVSWVCCSPRTVSGKDFKIHPISNIPFRING